MGSSINSIGLSSTFLNRSVPPLGVSSEDRAHRLATVPDPTRSPTDSLELSDAFRQRESLNVRARTELNVAEDGQIETRSEAKLRYKYDFVSADGFKISVRLKANLNFKQSVQGDEFSQSLKLSAKASIKAIQQDVSSATASLQQAAGASPSLAETVSRALDLFGGLTDVAASDFVESDPLDGDQLLTGIVDAFNEFAHAVLQGFLADGEAQQVLPHERSADTEENTTEDIAVDPTPGGSLPSIDVPIAPTPAPEPLLVADSLKPPESQPAGGTDSSLESASDDTQENSLSVEPTVVEPASDDGDRPETTEKTAGATLFKLRFRIVQSLTNLAGTFDSDARDATFSHSVFQSSVDLMLRAHGDGESFDDSLVPRQRFDLLG